MKHIVLVIGNYKNGGVAMRATNLANAFAKKGYPSTILVTKDISENVFFEHHKNVEIVSLQDYVSKHSADKSVKNNSKKRLLKIRLLKYIRYISKFFPKSDLYFAKKIKELRKSADISVFADKNSDCIYISFGLEYLENTFNAIKKGKNKLIYAERTTPSVEFPKAEFEAKQIIKKLQKADKVILQTHTSLEFYKSYNLNATVINNPVKSNLPVPYNGERKKTVVTFCRVSTEKNLPLLFDAFVEFHKTHSDYKLEIYGNTVTEDEEKLRELYRNKISEMNADKFISIYPARADIHSVVLDCAMFVSSSDFEGLSNSMIEAMAIGLPCVCTDCIGGGAREVIKNEENGLLVPIKNSEALCNAMCRMADDKDLTRKCSENAQKIRIDLSVDKISDKWIEAIEQIQ